MRSTLGYARTSWLVAMSLAVVSAAAQVAAPQAKLRVAGFQVSGATLLAQREIDAVLLPLLGERTIDELQRAAAAVQALYAAEGYGAVVAYVPPQTSEGGIVKITVVEGKVAAVAVKGNRRFSAQNIRASLPALKEGTTPRVRDIDQQLRIANENPAKEVQLLLKPGQRSGETDAEVTVVERPLQRLSVGLDNTGNELTGDWRVHAGWQHASLTGHDDVASVQAQTSPSDPGKVRVVGAGYRWPLYGARIVLDAYAAYSDIDGATTQSLAGDIAFNGRGRIAGARAAWYLPRRGELDQRLALALDRRDYLNRCTIAGQNDLCGPAGASVSVTPLAAEYLAQATRPWPMSLALSVHHNVGLGGAHADAADFDAARPGAKRRYTALRWNASAAWPVAEDWQLRLRLTGQYSSDALVSGEQFGIGGASSVRGYAEREVVGDSGAFASLELGGPELLSALGVGSAGALRPLAFVDAGHVRNRGEAPCVDIKLRCSLASLGVGVRLQLGGLQARLDFARVLDDAARTKRGDTKAHVGVYYGF